MTKYAVLTSGSCGNSYAFYDGKSCILVDAGLTLTGLKRRLEQVDIPFDALSDVLVTHMHPDHSKGLGVLYRAKGVCIHASRQCFESDERLFAKLGLKEDMISIFSFGDELFAGAFHAVPFRTSHDSAGSAGYFIENGDSRFFLMTDTGIIPDEAWDLSRSADVKFIESNYDEEMLRFERGDICQTDRQGISFFRSAPGIKPFSSCIFLTTTILLMPFWTITQTVLR